MDIEDKMSVTKLEEIKVNDLNEFFQDMFNLRDICDDFISLFKKEEKYYLNEEKYNEILEDEAIMIEDIHQIVTEIRESHKDIIEAFYSRRIEREKDRVLRAYKEIEKKPRQPKEEDN